MNTDDEAVELAEPDGARTWIAEQADLITLEDGFDS